MDENAKLCTISMDEMSLKVNIAYDSSKDEIIGLKDFRDGEKGTDLQSWPKSCGQVGSYAFRMDLML